MIQIGNEGGFLPAAGVLTNTPVGYEYFRRTITVLNVTNKTLFLGPAERADVIIDFSKVPGRLQAHPLQRRTRTRAGASTPASTTTPATAARPTSGGAPNTIAGYGPDTRTIMQFRVSGPASTPFSVADAEERPCRPIFAADQPKPIVPEPAYDAAYNANFPLNYMHVLDSSLTFTPTGVARSTASTSPAGGSATPAPDRHHQRAAAAAAPRRGDGSRAA